MMDFLSLHFALGPWYMGLELILNFNLGTKEVVNICSVMLPIVKFLLYTSIQISENVEFL